MAKPVWECEGLDLSALAETHGTPYYLYDADAIKQRIQDLRTHLRGLASIYYAVKANPNLKVLRSLEPFVDGVDISSGGELAQILAADHGTAHVSFAGPAKTQAELRSAIDARVGCISVESIRELRECAKIAHQRRTRARIIVRVNPASLNRSFGMKMGGRPIQFGIDENELPSAIREVQRMDNVIDFRGLHVYAGSQCFEVEGVVSAVSDTLRIVREMEAASGLYCEVVNLGGGFGVSHTEVGVELPLEEAATALVPLLKKFRDESSRERRLIFELGRYLTARAGLYVVRVIGSKQSGKRKYYMVDGGLNHHLAAAGTFGAVLRSNFILWNLSRPDGEPVRCSIAGPSCNPTDLLAVGIDMPEPEPGDLLGVMNAGSYGLTASPLLFLGRPTPAELVYHQGKIHVGRHPRTVLDFN